MELVLVGLTILSVLELLIWGPLWRWRREVAWAIMPFLLGLTGLWLSLDLNAAGVLFTVLSLYSLVNLWRLTKNRLQSSYLFHATRATALWLMAGQALLVAAAWLVDQWQLSALGLVYGLVSLQLVAAIVLLASTLRNLRKTQPPAKVPDLPDKNLPTLTVAIPARNETTALEECLHSLVANNYPKLEILVLDDCSQNKRTPEIIRSFAQDGVRFIAGEVPPEKWLAKNYAYQQLAEAASGEVLLFCGADCRFEPQTLNTMVEILLAKQKQMISFIPQNRLHWPGKLKQLLIQPSRYAWELGLPRRYFNRPPVLSTCWLIKRRALSSAGGFAAVSRKCVPESYLAHQTVQQFDGYSFVQATAALGLNSVKDFPEQRETAIRTRYPQLHRRPEMVTLVSLAEIIGLLLPPILTILALLSSEWPLAALAGLSTLLNLVNYSKIVNLTYRQTVLGGLWFGPIAVIYDVGLLNYSMWQYEFNEVIWKGRNVCIPVMQAIPRLPPLPNRDVV